MHCGRIATPGETHQCAHIASPRRKGQQLRKKGEHDGHAAADADAAQHAAEDEATCSGVA